MKTINKVSIAIGAFLLVMLISCGVFEIADSDHYNYQGYVVDIVQDDNGDTVIVTLSGNTESRFTLKWYTQVKADENKREITEGDLVMLSTTRHSNTNIKNMRIHDGYSTQGKLVYMNGLICPFVLATAESTNAYYLVSIVTHDNSTLEGMSSGDIVRFYHATPVYTTTITTVADASILIEDGTAADLTENEIAFIESQGYTAAKE